MNAYKCDRCGGFYERYSAHNGTYGVRLSEKWADANLNSLMSFDLCPGCITELHEFMGDVNWPSILENYRSKRKDVE